MSGDAKSGMGADVGLKKKEEPKTRWQRLKTRLPFTDNMVTTQKEGSEKPQYSKSAWIQFFILVVLSIFGVWKLIEILLSLL